MRWAPRFPRRTEPSDQPMLLGVCGVFLVLPSTPTRAKRHKCKRTAKESKTPPSVRVGSAAAMPLLPKTRGIRVLLVLEKKRNEDWIDSLHHWIEPVLGRKRIETQPQCKICRKLSRATRAHRIGLPYTATCCIASRCVE